MKLMLFWSNDNPEMEILINGLTKTGHELVYWVGGEGDRHLNPQGCIFHEHYAAWDGKPAQHFNSRNVTPISSERLASLYDLESTILTMMNKRYDASFVEERKSVYRDMLAYWTFVLDELSPEGIVFTTVPHSIYDYIVYTLAKERGIKTIMFEDTWIAGRLIWCTDYRLGSEEFRNALERNKGKKFSPSDLSPEVAAYFLAQTGEKISKPIYLQAQEKGGRVSTMMLYRLKIALNGIARGTLPRLAVAYLRRVWGPNLRREYNKLVVGADFNKPFVYFPLGFQPERTNCPQGGVYYDNIAAVRVLAASLPEGWEVYVKEHPSQWLLRTKERYSSVRYQGYYARLAAIPRVRLVPITESSQKLMDHARVVATVTGTPGWESLFRHKRPIIFGYPWYVPVPYVMRVSSVQECTQLLQSLSTRSTVSDDELLVMLKSLEEATVRGYLAIIRDHRGVVPFDVPVSREESMNSIVRVIGEVLK